MYYGRQDTSHQKEGQRLDNQAQSDGGKALDRRKVMIYEHIFDEEEDDPDDYKGEKGDKPNIECSRALEGFHPLVRPKNTRTAASCPEMQQDALGNPRELYGDVSGFPFSLCDQGC